MPQPTESSGSIDAKGLAARRDAAMARIFAGIGSGLDLFEILRLVRDAALEVGGFDRAGVWILDERTARGSWGTDAAGNPRDERHLMEELPLWSQRVHELIARRCRFYLEEWPSSDLEPGSTVSTVPHAVVGMYAGDRLVGLLSVDNLLTGRAIHDSDIEPLLSFADQAAVAIHQARLIEELHQTRDALIRSEKMRAVGELASGVAHNMNNVLTAVLGYAQLISQDTEATARIRHYARIIERATVDGADITRRLQQAVQLERSNASEAFDLSAAVRDAIDLTRPFWSSQAAARGASVQMESDLDPQVYTRGSASEVREVAVNLLRNAVDAMPNGGAIRVACFRQDAWVVLRVEDCGRGMDEQTRRRVFEPFFTTKGAGIGLGLGLAVTWGIVHRHGGEISVESRLGDGSCFTVRLPACDPSPERDVAGLNSPFLGPSRRILLVEDEELVAGSLARMLERIGCSVELAASGEEALGLLDSREMDYDVVVSDHGMPGMTGMALLAAIHGRYPRIRRVLLSGWGERLPDETGAAAELTLAKPIRMQALAEALASLNPSESP